eukprot:760603-Hanusia_phi.AAC.1
MERGVRRLRCRDQTRGRSIRLKRQERRRSERSEGKMEADEGWVWQVLNLAEELQIDPKRRKKLMSMGPAKGK